MPLPLSLCVSTRCSILMGIAVQNHFHIHSFTMAKKKVKGKKFYLILLHCRISLHLGACLFQLALLLTCSHGISCFPGDMADVKLWCTCGTCTICSTSHIVQPREKKKICAQAKNIKEPQFTMRCDKWGLTSKWMAIAPNTHFLWGPKLR